jgi:Class II histone deacetylase complex subunits 2 and 3
VRRRDQEGSRAIVREEYKAPRIHRPKYLKKRVVPSSSPSIKIPETQQEVLPYRETVAVEVKRPVDFHSQDYSTVTGSQVISVAVTEDTAASKDTTEGDSTLGSSIPPDSPIQAESGSSTREESSNASPSHPRAGSGFWNNIVTNFTGCKQSVSSSVDRPRGGQQSQYSSLKLLVDRSDPISEADTLPSRLTAEPLEHRDSIQPSSSFLAARAADLDLQPIVDPDQCRREIESEAGLEFLSAVSSPGGSRNQDGVGLRPPPTPEPAVTGRRTRRSQGGNLSSPRRVAASRAELRHHGAPERLTTPIRVVRGKPTSPNDSEILAASNLLSAALSMSNSQQEPSPHMGRPPSATSEKTLQPDFRDQLRQLRAAARSNQNSRSGSQAKTGQTSSPGGKAMEMGSPRRLSPEKNSQSAATSSTPTQDQPIPSLENVDAAAGEMEVDEVDGEPALSSSLAPPPPVLDAALGKSIMPLHLHEAEPAISELDIPTMPLLQPAEFVVPLPIDGRIKHQYVAELKERYKDIDDFLNFPRSKRLVDAMGDMIGQLNNTVVHTDLGLNGSMTQTASTTEEVLWAEDASSKFAFLAQIINILRGFDHHIVVVARSGPTLDLIQTYLRGKNVNYRQHSRTGSVGDLQEGDRDDPMRYTLLSTHSESLKYLPRSASLIIAFDDSFDAAMLPAWCSTSPFIPILLLLVINSAEHVGRCLAQDTPEPERLRRLVKAVVHVHKELGEMPFHLEFRHDLSLDPGARLALVKKDLGAKIAHAARRTAEALQSGNFALNFKLRPIGELDLAGLEDQPLSTEESKEVSSSASRAGTPAGQKRLRVRKVLEVHNHSDRNLGRTQL